MKRKADAAVGAASDTNPSAPATSAHVPKRAKTSPPSADGAVPTPLPSTTSQAVAASKSPATPKSLATSKALASATSASSRSGAASQPLVKPAGSRVATASQQAKKQATSCGDKSQASSQPRPAKQSPAQVQGCEDGKPTVPSNEAPPPTKCLSIANNPQGRTPPPSPLDRYAGRYIVSYYPAVNSEFPIEIIVVGRLLWGRFDLGSVKGVLQLLTPLDSEKSASMRWRGRETETGEFYGGIANGGWISFPKDGKIEGYVDLDEIHFGGRRVADVGADGEINSMILRKDWNYYHANDKLANRWDKYM
ncbi:hypothetical protein V8C44DRAFT_325251 [Trichoderma aethiopicum]